MTDIIFCTFLLVIMVSKRHGLIGTHGAVYMTVIMKITAKRLHPGVQQA